MADAFANDLPTYAPTLFAEAAVLWRRAQDAIVGAADSAKAEELLTAAADRLQQAAERADGARGLLSEVVRLRYSMLRSPAERFYAAELLRNAEEHYRAAVRAAESNEMGLAQRHAAAARESYREAPRVCLHRGLLDHLEQAIADAPLGEGDPALEPLARRLKALQDSARRGQTGDIPVAALRRRGFALRSSIAALTDLGPRGGEADDVLAPPGDVWAPGTFGPPEPTLTMRIGRRTVDSLAVSWHPGAGSDTSTLLRQQAGGPWVAVAEFGVLRGLTSYVDTGLLPDTRYNYRIRSESDYGSSITPINNRACGHTRDAAHVRVWRLQLRIRTADVANAGTSDDVQVRLNSPLVTHSPFLNSTWMDYGPRPAASGSVSLANLWVDDFERNRDFTYDLQLRSVRELTDITMLTLRKEGSDALAIAEIELLVNGVQVFEQRYGDTSSTCLWLDDSDGHANIYTTDYPEIRAHPAWQAFVSGTHAPPLSISNEEIVSRIEGTVGHQLHGQEADWGHRYGSTWVSASRVSDEVLHVDLDLSGDAPILGDPEVDVDFDLRFSVICADDGTATFHIATENFNSSVDFDLLDEILTFGAANLAEDYIAGEVRAAFEPITESIALDAGGVCPKVVINDSGDVTFQLA